MAVKLPSPYEVSGPASLRPVGGVAVADTSDIAAGIQNIGQGIGRLGSGWLEREQVTRKRQNVADVAKAEAEWTKRSLDIGNQFDQDGDYATFDERAGGLTDEAKIAAGEMIRDDETRAAWLLNTENSRLTLMDQIGDKGRRLSQEADRVALSTAIADSAVFISNPEVPDEVRQKARDDISGTISRGITSGLITPAEGYTFTKTYLDGAESQLAANRFQLDLQFNPVAAMAGTGISSRLTGSDVASAAAQVGGGTVALDPALAQQVATQLGDRALPDDPALAKAYLSDPEVNARYSQAAMDMLTTRYKGDVTAAVVAAAPGGSAEIAEAWVKSGHDENVLPPKVRNHYLDVMEKIAPASDAVPIPIRAAPGVDLESVDVAVLDRFEQLQTAFGKTLPILPGAAEGDNPAARRSLVVDIAKLPKDERLQLIRMASSMGFTGIGVDGDKLVVDTGAKRAIGKPPAWADEVLDQHVAGEFSEAVVTPAARGVDPRYAALSFDQRLAAYEKAKVAVENGQINLRAGLAVVTDNAPAAIAQGGTYRDPLPSAEDFVAAYGAAEGIERYKAFDASVDVAQTTFGMRTMTADQINDAVENARPTDDGDMAAIQGAEYAKVSEAAAATMKARTDDPAGYVMDAFPAVKQAWEALNQPITVPDQVDKNAVRQSQMRTALTVMADTQAKLGIENPKLLPEAVANTAAAVFKDPNRSEQERIGALTGLVMATSDDDQQEAIATQLMAAGVPESVRGALYALADDRPAAASQLFRAALYDDTKLKPPPEFKSTDIDTRISERVFDTDQIGDIAYGISDGTADNFTRAGNDKVLFERAVKLRLIDGSATKIEDAIALTIKDMFGDVKVVTGNGGGTANVRALLPAEADERTYRAGFDTLLEDVGNAALADLSAGLTGIPTNNSEAAIAQAVRDNRVDMLLEEGFFASSGDGYVFVDPQTGQAVPDPGTGEALAFTREEVLAAGEGNERPWRPSDGYANLPGGLGQ